MDRMVGNFRSVDRLLFIRCNTSRGHIMGEKLANNNGQRIILRTSPISLGGYGSHDEERQLSRSLDVQG